MDGVFVESGLRTHIEHYAFSHQTPVNKALHFVGIPVLMIGLLGLAAKVAFDIGVAPPLQPNLAWGVLLYTGIWYLKADRKIGLLSVFMMIVAYVIGSYLPTWLLFSFFGLGVILHVVGHYGFEGKPPAAILTARLCPRSARVASRDVGRVEAATNR